MIKAENCLNSIVLPDKPVLDKKRSSNGNRLLKFRVKLKESSIQNYIKRGESQDCSPHSQNEGMQWINNQTNSKNNIYKEELRRIYRRI